MTFYTLPFTLTFIVFSIITGGNSLATWKTEPQSGDLPAARSSAGLAALGQGLWMCCGHTQCPDNDFCVSAFYNDVHFYSFQANSWDEPVITSVDKPGIRTFAPMVADSESDSFVIFGGLNYSLPVVNVYGDLWRYFTKTNSWVELAQYNEGPGQRAGSLMVLYENKLYVGFGLNEQAFGPGATNNDLWTFDLETGLWELKIPDNSSNPDQPYRRYRPQYHLDSKRGKILLHSGDMAIGDPVESVNDTWVYDIEQNTWTFLNNGLQNRQDAVTALHKKDFLVMFGDTEDDEGRCENNVTGSGNNPRDELFKLNYITDPDNWEEFSTNQNPGKLMRSAFTQRDQSNGKSKLYMWSGFHFPCNVPGNGTLVYETGLFSLNLDNI